MEELVVASDRLEADIEQHLRVGYRLDMVMPADAPHEALLSKNGEVVRLVSEVLSPGFSRPDDDAGQTKVGTQNEWVSGRAGMEYRDLIPGRMDGRVIASHIRLTKGGEVPDYVHYHKVRFQMIYCLAGSIRAVYEDCGEPFWLNPGDCVLQPPEIRHRVLECTAGSEVLEIGMPAVHETWVEHEIELPTSELRPDREFSGQRFLRHIAADAERVVYDAGGLSVRDSGMLAASGELADVWNIRLVSDGKTRQKTGGMYAGPFQFFYIIAGDLGLSIDNGDTIPLNAGDSFVVPRLKTYMLDCSPNIELLEVKITA